MYDPPPPLPPLELAIPVVQIRRQSGICGDARRRALKWTQKNAVRSGCSMSGLRVLRIASLR